MGGARKIYKYSFFFMSVGEKMHFHQDDHIDEYTALYLDLIWRPHPLEDPADHPHHLQVLGLDLKK